MPRDGAVSSPRAAAAAIASIVAPSPWRRPAWPSRQGWRVAPPYGFPEEFDVTAILSRRPPIEENHVVDPVPALQGESVRTREAAGVVPPPPVALHPLAAAADIVSGDLVGIEKRQYRSGGRDQAPLSDPGLVVPSSIRPPYTGTGRVVHVPGGPLGVVPRLPGAAVRGESPALNDVPSRNSEGQEDVLVHIGHIVLAGHLFDDETEHEIADIGVDALGSRCELERLAKDVTHRVLSSGRARGGHCLRDLDLPIGEIPGGPPVPPTPMLKQVQHRYVRETGITHLRERLELQQPAVALLEFEDPIVQRELAVVRKRSDRGSRDGLRNAREPHHYVLPNGDLPLGIHGTDRVLADDLPVLHDPERRGSDSVAIRETAQQRGEIDHRDRCRPGG